MKLIVDRNLDAVIAAYPALNFHRLPADSALDHQAAWIAQDAEVQADEVFSLSEASAKASGRPTSAVTASQLPSPVPAQPLSGFDMTVHVVESAVQTPPLMIPSAHENSADNEYPELHVGVHVVPCASSPALAAALQPSPSVPSVGVV